MSEVESALKVHGFDGTEYTLTDAEYKEKEPLIFLIGGYSEYIKDVVKDRSIVPISGFKPSQMRILYGVFVKHKGAFLSEDFKRIQDLALTGSSKTSGDTLTWHPHSETGVYETLVRMVDSTEIFNVPLFVGKGSFGKVYSNDSPSASRYTMVKPSVVSRELFQEMDGIKMVPNYNDTDVEPEQLPVGFPIVLVNASSGIAVGVASNIPAFNFHDVNQAVIDIIETGSIQQPMYPDYSSGGQYVHNEVELEKIMKTGRGRITLRGEWTVAGKEITIKSVPYYTNTDQIRRKVLKLKQEGGMQGVTDIREITDMLNGCTLLIECSSKKIVSEVLLQLLRFTTLEMTITTNILVIDEGYPREYGVEDLLKRWVSFREGVLIRAYEKREIAVKVEIRRYNYLVALLEKMENYLDLSRIMITEGTTAAYAFLEKLFPEIEKEDCAFICDRNLSSMSGYAKRIDRLVKLKEKHEEIKAVISDPRSAIVSQLKRMNEYYDFPRKMEVTSFTYNYETLEKKKQEVKSAPTPVVIQINGKFIKKMMVNAASSKLEGTEVRTSTDCLSYIDNRGRLLRVMFDNLDFCTPSDRGVYLPKYLGIEDNFEIVAYEYISDKTVGYMYSDGYASVVDYSEWKNVSRLQKVTTNGVSDSSHLILSEIEMDKPFMFLMTSKGHFGIFTSDFKRKARTARTRIVVPQKGDYITHCVSLTTAELLELIPTYQNYMNKLGLLNPEHTFNSEYFQKLIGG